ncbi:hypothetical protein SAMN05192574_105292 [Mucilaginibacter gossypiicola]|uniref:Uncharacterized protein n=2 Tax=Mucilaginibacter gossypiicola TaxID=551995 RepID=A0A1H8LXD2_9SPHI|nr:hypothetical protein SAMN05192574_105292 [Mucilaginibacter gossypiicola]
MEISRIQLEKFMQQVAELAAITTLVKAGLLRPYLKKSEAFNIYGRKNIERWLEQGLITPRKDGDHSAAWRLDRVELETIARAISIYYCLPP